MTGYIEAHQLGDWVHQRNAMYVKMQLAPSFGGGPPIRPMVVK